MAPSFLHATALILLTGGGSTNSGEIDFSRDIRPILSNHCLKCHGPDEETRESGLRLDQFESATSELESGQRAIVPAKPDESELLRRLDSESEDEVMPPLATNKPLSESQKKLLKEWIASGARYESHWAFVAPVQGPLPQVSQTEWPRNAVDHFILARLDGAKLFPSPEADRWTLARRLSLDLLGLPPSAEDSEAFVHDASPDAVERLIDRLIASPAFGERWARRWLDLARYADTNGYEKDRVRSIWPYRDWVINALNGDMPFNRFTIDQIAGDLASDSLDGKIATGFHRNTMLNEEGGIDPLEFRFYAMVDRVNTTGTTWLGMAIGCAQCHTHKFDPITQHDYYRFMAFLNNADEPEIPVSTGNAASERKEREAEIARLEDKLPEEFPVKQSLVWHTARPIKVESDGKAATQVLEDGAVIITGERPEKDRTVVTVECDIPHIAALRLEALADSTLPQKGPGRAENGNFVLSHLSIIAKSLDSDDVEEVKLVGATADFSQKDFPADHAIDGNSTTGWAIAGSGDWNKDRSLTVEWDKPRSGSKRYTIVLEQNYGGHHTLGKFRLSFGCLPDGRPLREHRLQAFEHQFQEWAKGNAPHAAPWTVLKPSHAASNLPVLTILDDHSILSSGDQTKSDTYTVTFPSQVKGVTSLRLEAIPDPRLPKGGPGRIYYEGPFGDFWLSEVNVSVDGKPVKIKRAKQTFAAGSSTAALCIDGNPQTAWAIDGGQGEPHVAIFDFDRPIDIEKALEIRLLFEKYYSAGLGRFRCAVTCAPREDDAPALLADVEDALAIAPAKRSEDQSATLRRAYIRTAPELAAARERIKSMKAKLPAPPTTLAMQERAPGFTRPTHVHKRGEFLQPTDAVTPELPSMFEPLPPDAPHDRLALARWLVDPANPLTARVTVNRHWAVLFGRGIVRTTEDFGYQGDPPTHPDLLDWLAVELQQQGWSLKSLIRQIVSSATYRQSAQTTDLADQIDPQNRLLAHAPRIRLDAELVRDSVLATADLLAPVMGGPSVFPPQPAGVTSEGTYGPLQWQVSQGADRYRRGLYTFLKRTAPYAMFITFDGSSGEACVSRREISNTPLQALTLLNDPVFIEACQELGRNWSSSTESVHDRIERLFRTFLTRPPKPGELEALEKYFTAQRERLEKKELDATAINPGPPESAVDRAAWTLVARAILNLDEFVTRE